MFFASKLATEKFSVWELGYCAEDRFSSPAVQFGIFGSFGTILGRHKNMSGTPVEILVGHPAI